MLQLHESFAAAETGSRATALSDVPKPRAVLPARGGSSKEALRLRLYATLLLLDVLFLLVGFGLVSAVQFGEILPAQTRDMLFALVPLYVGLTFQHGAYSIEVLQEPRHGLKRAAKALGLAVAILVGVAFYLKVSEEFSRLTLGAGSVVALMLQACGRWLFGKWAGNRVGWKFTNEVVLVDGVSFFPTSGEIVLIADQLQLSPTSDDPHLLDRLGRLLKNCDRVVLASAPERRGAWCRMLRAAHIDVEVLAPELDSIGALGMRRLSGKSTVLVATGPLGFKDRVLKRAFDLAVAAPTLVALAPVMLIIALSIRIESPGPTFFRQPRVGRGNRIFYVLKFRSMRAERSDQNGMLSTTRDDQRVTRVGSFLRRTSLDELPQLFNVVAGDMSLVGPRPHALQSTAEDQLFWAIDDRYWDRHAVKPGMTGLAQIRGYRGATEVTADLTNRLQSDLEYLNGWTLSRDLLILFRTARVLVHSRAY